MRSNFKYAMIAVAALTLGLTSCSNDDDVAKGTSGEKAKLNIRITTPTTRASVTGSSNVSDDKTINNFTAFVVDGNSLSSGYCDDASEGLSGQNAITTSTRATTVYVIANAGNLTSSITTVSKLTDYIADLNDASKGSQTQTNGRWATGKTDLTPASFEVVGTELVATKNVELTFIAARIMVTIENKMVGYGENKSLTLERIAVLNATGESRLFPESGSTSLIPSAFSTGKNFYEGLAKANNFTYYPTSGSFTMAETLLSDNLASTPSELAKKTYYYYVFENDAKTAAQFPTIVTLIGTKGDGVTPVYWPVHLAPYEKWADGSGSTSNSVVRGNSYNIHITLTGDPFEGDGGTDDPTIPVVNGAKVQVTVTVNEWFPITLNKEF